MDSSGACVCVCVYCVIRCVQFGQSVLLMCVTTLAHLLRDSVNMPSTAAPFEASPTMDLAEFLQVDPALYYAETDHHLRPYVLLEDDTGGESNAQRVYVYSRVHLQCWILYRLLHASHWHTQRDAGEGCCDGSPSRVIRWEHEVNTRSFIARHDMVISVFLDWVSKTTTVPNTGANAATTMVDTAWIPEDWPSIAAVSRARFSSPPPPRPPHDDRVTSSTTRKASRCCLS